MTAERSFWRNSTPDPRFTKDAGLWLADTPENLDLLDADELERDP